MIECRDLSLVLGEFSLDHCSIHIEKGDYYFIMGPSGAGKTVLLELLAGLQLPDAGSVWRDGQDITTLPPEERNIGLVYQDYSLFPHMTVENNIAFGLEMMGSPRETTAAHVESLLNDLRIGHLRHRSPMTLSGGEQQRVALARALARDPPVLLLDEPLAALDLAMRGTFIAELRRIHREKQLTIIHVSHDPREVRALGSRMAVIVNGRILQEGGINEVFNIPQSQEIAQLIGVAEQSSE